MSIRIITRKFSFGTAADDEVRKWTHEIRFPPRRIHAYCSLAQVVSFDGDEAALAVGIKRVRIRQPDGSDHVQSFANYPEWPVHYSGDPISSITFAFGARAAMGDALIVIHWA